VIAITLYTGLKFVHVLLATVAIGINVSYGVWLADAAKKPAHLAYALDGVKKLDDRLANPAYGLLLVTGLWMVVEGPWDFSTDWIQLALGLYVAIMLLGILGYSRALKRQIAAAGAGPESPEYQAANRQAGIIAAILAVLIIAIVYVMVTKPTF
jgi:uncharacterized membrane protein